MSNEEFNKKLSKILANYVRKEFGDKGIDRFARSYAEIHSEKGLSTIKKMLNTGHSFSEDEVKNLSEIMNMPTLKEEYYDSLISDLESKKQRINNVDDSNIRTNPATIKDAVRSEDVLFAIENYRFGEAKTPMLIFCDNADCIEYIISMAGIEAVKMEDVAWDPRFMVPYERSPHDVIVGVINLEKDSSINRVSKPYQTYKNVIENDIKKHFILIVKCDDSFQQKLMFKSFRNEPHAISYKTEITVEKNVKNQKEHPEKGIGWGYGTLPTVKNATYITSLFHSTLGEYLCVHEDFGITWNWGKAVAKRVSGVIDEHYRSFASLIKYNVEMTRDMDHGDEPVSQESGIFLHYDAVPGTYDDDNDDDNDDDDWYHLDYELDRYKVLTHGANAWYVSEFQRASENTKKLTKKEFKPALKASNHYKATSPLLEGRWYLPSLVELVVARKDIEPGRYWTSSRDHGVNILYDSVTNEVVEPDGTPQEGWVMPFILEKGKY